MSDRERHVFDMRFRRAVNAYDRFEQALGRIAECWDDDEYPEDWGVMVQQVMAHIRTAKMLLTRAMSTGGIEACAQVVAPMLGSAPERARALAYRLYTIAERKGWAQEAYAYNALVVAWPEINSRAAELQAAQPEQMAMY